MKMICGTKRRVDSFDELMTQEKKSLGRSISQRRLRVFQQSKFNTFRLLPAVLTQTKTSKTAS